MSFVEQEKIIHTAALNVNSWRDNLIISSDVKVVLLSLSLRKKAKRQLLEKEETSDYVNVT